MAPPSLPALPSNLKSIQHYLKIAMDYETRDPATSYWCNILIVKLLEVRLFDYLFIVPSERSTARSSTRAYSEKSQRRYVVSSCSHGLVRKN